MNGAGVRSVVRAVVTAEFPRREIRDVTVVRRGNTKRTTVVSFDATDPVVVQLSARIEQLETEAALTTAIADRTTMPVPRVLRAGTIHEDEYVGTGQDRAYVITALETGENLHSRFVELDESTQRRIVGQFGRYLAELHGTFRFDRYGGVSVSTSDGFETGFTATGPNEWRSWFYGYLSAGIDALPDAFDPIRADLYAAIERAPCRQDPPARLYPWDFRPGNALVEDGQLSSVLDWGSPLSADPALSIAKAEYVIADWYVDRSEPLRTAFERGYEQRRELPQIPSIYRITAVVRSAVDSSGVVTRPGYPERTGREAIEFHLSQLDRYL